MVTRDGQTLVIAVLGLGEAGSAIAVDLTAAGVRVRGHDPAVPAAMLTELGVPPQMARASSALHERLAASASELRERVTRADRALRPAARANRAWRGAGGSR